MQNATSYMDVKVSEAVRKGLKFLVVDPPTTKRGRQHRRLVGSADGQDPAQPLIAGRPLLYFDTYIKNGKTYTYARHKGTPYDFFSALDSLI